MYMGNIQYTVQCTWKINSTLYNVHAKYTVHCTMYISTLYNVHAKYTVHCTMYMGNIQYTVLTRTL